MSKRILSMALVLMLAGSLLAACGSGSNDKNEKASNETANAPSNTVVEDTSKQYGDTGGLKLPLVDKPTKITWMVVSETPLNDKLVAKEIEKRTGITVEFQNYSSATFEDKLRLIVASGKLPDIFNGLKPSELKKIGQQKAVVAINDYVDMLPNFKKLYVDENPWVANSFGDENNKLYSWPIYNMNRDVNHGMMYRKDIFDKNNIPEWTNTEEFYQALKKLKEIYPDSYPMASKTKEDIFRDLAYGWGIGGMSYPAYYAESDKTWKFAGTQPEYKEMIDFLKKLYNEGLLDQEFLTATSESWTAKMTTGKSFVTWDWIGRLELFYNQVSAENPEYNLRYGNPVGPTGNIRTLPKIDADFGISVANNANKEAALKLLDYLTSPSGSELITLGVEGVNFNFDDKGKPVYPELKDLATVEIKALEENYGMWVEGMYLNPDHRSVYYNFTEKEQEAQDKIVSANKFEPMDPILNLTEEEIATIAELQTSIMKSMNEFNAKYIVNKNYGDKEWADWLAKAEKMGASKYADVYNQAQKRYDANK
ncbi:ABC transporter substrate-binding protein [Paenibacillus selenitireducens]|uniref:ABC transporter substrate-binding protein n=1 Tax=Paenibacillus selenitireducens TaxID=1324314 RepID=A0A1T2X1R5_9BACL|nr:extracellular solute-binding protein [Paenibacillus selenitireducens]OPA73513.1 ABC transporter substrate-binding protein [Paenibacillus selenitireducens]